MCKTLFMESLTFYKERRENMYWAFFNLGYSVTKNTHSLLWR